MKDKYGLIGDPISTSKSPALFKAGYDGQLEYDLIEGSDFETSWRKFLEEYTAINITAPFKEKAFSQAVLLAKNGYGSVSGPCLKIGATNLVVKTDEGIVAHNSDFTGIILCVAEALFPGIVSEFYKEFGASAYIKIHQFVRLRLETVYGEKPQALIVGCGGAGKAAAVAAAEMGFETALMNRTTEKAQSIADSLPEYNFIVDPVSDFRSALKECDLVIYTLPVKLDGIDELSADDFAGEGYLERTKPPKIILEANYKTPAFTEEALMKMSASGCKYVPGRNWLVYQALTGYGIMTGKEPDCNALLGVDF